MLRLLLLLAAALSLGGCVSVRDARTLIVKVQPGQEYVAVESRAVAECNSIFWLYCKLTMTLNEAGKEPAPAPTPAPDGRKCPDGTSWQYGQCYPIRPVLGGQ